MNKEIIGMRIHATSYVAATDEIGRWAREGQSRYVCAGNVHMAMEAWDSPLFRAIVNRADLVTPDGMPLVWIMRWKGQRAQQRVYGPTLMLHVLELAARDNLPVGFYGGTSNVLDALIRRLERRFPGLIVTLACSPPFRDLSHNEDEELVRDINASGARIVFVGLGCPRQEQWMGDHRGRVKAVMIGVGAAFDFHSGMKPQAPVWLQRIGLEWLFRLVSEPRRLWRRYLYHNPRFIILAVADMLGLLR